MGTGPQQRAVLLYRGKSRYRGGRQSHGVRIASTSGRQSLGGEVRGSSCRDQSVPGGRHSIVPPRWGVGPNLSPTVSGRYLSFSKREYIALLRAQNIGAHEIERRLGRAPSTISREVRRNASTRTYRLEYRASTAQWLAARRNRHLKPAKMVTNERLRDYLKGRLAGVIRTLDGVVVPGPAALAWKGRNKPHSQDRHWTNAWSPEQISRRPPVVFPMMGRCGSATRRSTRLSTSRVVELSSASSSAACAPGVRCACHVRARASGLAVTLLPTS